jgi:RHS repeat-associated protein
LESYDYLGSATVVRREHSQPGVDLTYIKQSAESNGDAGDPYIGLDRFGRVVDQRWLETSSGTATDRFQYGYDRDSNRLYRDNLVNTAFGELYAYDDLNQLSSFQRGFLDGTKTGLSGSATRSQSWDFDALGNFDSLTTDGTGQSRTHNKQNEITTIGSTSLSYDTNGNLTQDQTGQQYVFDAWNRLVKVKDSGGTTLVSYEHDGLGRRIEETVGFLTRDLHYSAAWQVLEETIDGQAQVQYIWSPVYVDAIMLRDRDTNSDGSLDERLWTQLDANFNVTALVDESGIVVERYSYDPFGSVVAMSSTWGTLGTSTYEWSYLHQSGRLAFESGLIQFRRRDYNPRTGRWHENDPIGFDGMDSNLYRYIGNNPVGSLDPYGLVIIIEPRTIQSGYWFRYCERSITGLNAVEQCCANCCSCKVQHAYIGLVGPNGTPKPGTSAWGFYKGGVIRERGFGANNCYTYKKSIHRTLNSGSGKGKVGSTASDAEILDCIKNHAPTQPYSMMYYNCKSWATQAASNCGLIPLESQDLDLRGCPSIIVLLNYTGETTC